VADRRAEQRQAELQEMVAFQQRLTSVAVRRGVAGVVEALSDKLELPVAVLDPFGEEVASARADEAFLENAGAEVRRPSGARSRVRPSGESRTLMLQDLTDESHSRGWLAVEAAQTTNQTRLLIAHAASMLTLQMTRSAEVSALYDDLGSVAADLAFASPSTTDPNALARFGLSGAQGLRVLVAASRHGAPLQTRALHGVLAEMGEPHVSTPRPDHALVLVRGGLPDDTLHEVARRLADAGQAQVVLGASRPQPLARLRAGQAEALQAATSARIGDRRVGTYDALELATLLEDDDLRRRVSALSGAGLAQLLESTEAGDRELVKTLRYFLEANGSWEAASRQLAVHRHTLRQRIEKLTDRTGLDLASAHTRAATLLILLAHDRDTA
jgi:purine catabolism regulator